MDFKKVSIIPLALILIAIIGLTGCGASKTYVDESIAGERAQSTAAMAKVEKEIAENKAALDQMQKLQRQLEQKTDMVLNEAKGFEDYQVIWEGEIFFDFNSTDITVDGQAIIDQAGNKMSSNRSSVMEFEGFTDPSGSKSHNMTLGQKRAASAKYYLVDNFGINLFRMFLTSHGENKAVDMGDGKGSYAKMRKVKMKLWGKP